MDLSVVIPTRGRLPRLVATLRALQAQQLDGITAEAIVVDNGSQPLDLPDVDGPIPVRLLREPSEGTAAARNLAIEHAEGQVALFLGDDTPPASPDLLGRHLELHAQHPEKTYAVLGRMDWDPAIRPSEFMHWLMSAGFQSAYDGLAPGPVSPVLHFITSHSSTKSSLIVDAGGFDEEFPFYLEHVELGIRLQRQGMVLDYHPELLVYHDHPHTLAGYETRMEGVGKAARRLRERWPDETPWQVKGPERKWDLYPLAAPCARAALRVPTGRKLRGRAWGVLLMAAYARGYRSDESGAANPEPVAAQAG